MLLVRHLAQTTLLLPCVLSPQFSETVASEESKEILEDGFAEVVSTLVGDYDSGAMPRAQNEDFVPDFKKYIKVHGG